MAFDPRRFVQERIEWLRNEVGDETALAAVSGGVDSTTTAVLGDRALGKNLNIVFLDDGLMRDGEAEEVSKILNDLELKIEVCDVHDAFFEALKGIVDPEEKRKAFRNIFYRTLRSVSEKLGTRCLLQGTIAADIAETSKGVKTQHNVLTQIGIDSLKEYGYKIVEPLSALYKHEVRSVGEALGLPRKITSRRPFPGPGLSIRVLGEVTPERITLIRKVTRIVEEETEDVPCFQAFPILLNDRATGISDEGERRYGAIITVRVVDSRDAITATPSSIDADRMKRIVQRIISDEPSIVRVLYDLTPKPPSTIEFE